MDIANLVDGLTDEEAIQTLVVYKKSAKSTKINEATASQITKFLSINNVAKIQRTIMQKYHYAYVLLDTSNIAVELSTDTQYTWRTINYISPTTGTVCTVNNIRDLIGMRIYPITMTLTTPVGESNKSYINDVVNINNNFTVLIHEFASQAYIGRDSRRFHFSLFPALMNPLAQSFGPSITPASPYFEFTTSGKGNGWFWFKQPIVEFSTMTVSLGNPFDLIKLSKNVRTLIPIQLVYLAEK